MACATHVLPRFIQGTARPHKHQLRTKLPYWQVALLEYCMYCFDMIRVIRVVSKNGFHILLIWSHRLGLEAAPRSNTWGKNRRAETKS